MPSWRMTRLRAAVRSDLYLLGFHAIWAHRIAHFLFRRRMYTLARIISQVSRFFTGIEIHPGAKIGSKLFIDHGMGVVIGETCENRRRSRHLSGRYARRHRQGEREDDPTIGNRVVIASGAKVLGSFKVGDNSNIGANSVVLREVPPNSTVVGIPGRIVKRNGKRIADRLDHANIPDPLVDIFHQMQKEINDLKKQRSSS